MRNGTRLALGIVASAVLLAPAALGGDLNPPPGPVTATDRVTINPANVALPIVIDAPGSYVLTGPVLDCIGCDDLPTSGIVINASDVTLDCNGFRIVGDPGNSLNGIFVDAANTNVVIRNGIVRGWSGSGVFGSGDVTLESMRVIGCGQQGGAGIELGSNARIIDCTAQGNGGNGVFVGFGSYVEGCTSTGNSGNGIETAVGAIANGSVLNDCVARNNGLVGLSLAGGTSARGCAASQNGSHGIALGPGALASGCTAVFNGGDGITAFNALVHGCSTVQNTGTDISLAGGATSADSH